MSNDDYALEAKVTLDQPKCKFHGQLGIIKKIQENDWFVIELDDPYQGNGKRQWYAMRSQLIPKKK